jgi:hypothetical protein
LIAAHDLVEHVNDAKEVVCVVGIGDVDFVVVLGFGLSAFADVLIDPF